MRRTFSAGGSQQKLPYEKPPAAENKNSLPKITHKAQPPFHRSSAVGPVEVQFVRHLRPGRQPWANIPTNQEPLPPKKSTPQATGFCQPICQASYLQLFSQIPRFLARGSSYSRTDA